MCSIKLLADGDTVTPQKSKKVAIFENFGLFTASVCQRFP